MKCTKWNRDTTALTYSHIKKEIIPATQTVCSDIRVQHTDKTPHSQDCYIHNFTFLAGDKLSNSLKFIRNLCHR